jgi:multisubunit Na+/H+ antiporter MnhC subunit
MPPPHILIHVGRWAIENPIPALLIIAALVVGASFSFTVVLILSLIALAGFLGWGYLDWKKTEAQRNADALALQQEDRKQQPTP